MLWYKIFWEVEASSLWLDFLHFGLQFSPFGRGRTAPIVPGVERVLIQRAIFLARDSGYRLPTIFETHRFMVVAVADRPYIILFVDLICRPGGWQAQPPRYCQNCYFQMCE
jgi:hypothetical protein